MADSSSNGLNDLKLTVATTIALIKQLQATVPAKKSSQTEVNALDLAHDTASLTRAHTTKLSLLVINKPFTPSAITGILRELVAGALPGLASAIELCDAGRYTKAMSTELQYRAGKVISGLETLVKAIPLDGKPLSDDAKVVSANGMNKASLLPITGTIWEACDNVIELKKLGIAGLLIEKAKEQQALLRDALEELKEWAKENEESGEDDSADDSDVEDEEPYSADTMSGEGNIPKGDPDKIRPRLELSIKRLKVLSMLYDAVITRRIKALPTLPRVETPSEAKEGSLDVVKCLDKAMVKFKKLPEATDELASAFYDLDAEEIDKRMEECFLAGSYIANLLVKNWEGQEDQFTNWVSQFHLAMSKVSNR